MQSLNERIQQRGAVLGTFCALGSVEATPVPEADSALGAALLGQRALGLATNTAQPASEVIVPAVDAQARYADVYQRYVQAQPALLAMTP